MSMHSTIYGRAAFDAREHTTKAGKPMASCRLAVDVTGKDASDQETLWADALAFGRAAEDLARVEKGQFVSAMGKLTRGQFVGKDGVARESWTLLADGVVTARSGRPGQRRQPGNGARQQRPQHDPQVPFDDPMGF